MMYNLGSFRFVQTIPADISAYKICIHCRPQKVYKALTYPYGFTPCITANGRRHLYLAGTELLIASAEPFEYIEWRKLPENDGTTCIISFDVKPDACSTIITLNITQWPGKNGYDKIGGYNWNNLLLLLKEYCENRKLSTAFITEGYQKLKSKFI